MPTKTHPPGFITAGLPELVQRNLVMTFNPNRANAATEPSQSATAPPAAVAVVDAEQRQRDQWFRELVERCRASHVRNSTIELCLVETGRSRAELDEAVEAAD